MAPSVNYRRDRDVRASQVVLVKKNPPASAGDVRDVGSIPGSGGSPGGGHGNPLQFFFAWRIPWTEEPGRLQSVGLQLDMTEAT